MKKKGVLFWVKMRRVAFMKNKGFFFFFGEGEKRAVPFSCWMFVYTSKSILSCLVSVIR